MRMNIRDIIVPSARPVFETYIAILKRRGRAHGIMRIQTGNGEQRFWEYNNTLRTEGVNTPIVRGMARDITERKRAEDALRESEEQFRGLFNNSIDGVALHEIVLNDQGEPVDYIFLMANHRFETHTGLRVADILGKRVTQILPGIEKSNLIGIYGKVALTGEPTVFEMYFEPLQRHFNITAYQVGKGRFAVVFEDITERKQAEEKRTIANKELAFQNEEKEKRAAELILANKELAFQNEEKEKRAADLVVDT